MVVTSGEGGDEVDDHVVHALVGRIEALVRALFYGTTGGLAIDLAVAVGGAALCGRVCESSLVIAQHVGNLACSQVKIRSGQRVRIR